MKRFILLSVGLMFSATTLFAMEDFEPITSSEDLCVLETSTLDLSSTLGVDFVLSGFVTDNSVIIDARRLIVSDNVVYSGIVLDERCTPRIRDDVT